MGGKGRADFLRLSAALALACLGCVLLFALRVAISGRTFYSYLVWNLALAAVPYAVAATGSSLLSRAREGGWRTAAAVATATLWLVFYPNAPYIFTDFIHVINRTYPRASATEWLGVTALTWYDLLMNAAFAFLGHFIGLVSMWIVQASFARTWGKWPARSLVGVAIFLSGFGIYLGRFSRLNSWDVVLDPRKVLGEIAEASADPKAILFSAAFSLFILLTYAALVVFKSAGLPERRARKEG
jgi:uncharacterized membrane protein